MKNKITVKHQGIPLAITQEKNNRFVISDYSSGRRLRHVRTTEAEARDKAKEICELMAGGKKDLLELSPYESEIHLALNTLPPGLSLSQAASIIANACKIVEAAEIVPACRARYDTRPKKVKPKKVDEAVREFLARREARVSKRRYRTDECYLGIFSKAFGARWLHGMTTLEIKDWLNSRGWMPKTKNDAACLVRLMYSDAIERNHAVENPARIKREKIKSSDVEIFSPEQVERMLNAVEDELKPFLAVTFFSGLRKEEASRLSVLQVRDGLKSGAIFLPGSCAKTGRGRSVTICDNLRAWLQRYLPVDGPLLPVEWSGMESLDELPGHVERRSGVPWKRNAARHSFGTYHLRLTGDPAETVKLMGNSLAQLDRHYHSRADSVTPEAAEKYFRIMPATEAGIVIPMPTPGPAAEPTPAASAAGVMPSCQQSHRHIVRLSCVSRRRRSPRVQSRAGRLWRVCV